MSDINIENGTIVYYVDYTSNPIGCGAIQTIGEDKLTCIQYNTVCPKVEGHEVIHLDCYFDSDWVESNHMLMRTLYEMKVEYVYDYELASAKEINSSGYFDLTTWNVLRSI